jgi:predicted MFS family arabinose efflux permease
MHGLARRVLGDEIEPRLWPVLVTLCLAITGVYAYFAFFAIWALEVFEAPQAQIGVAFTVASLAGVLGAIAGGRISDKLGRRPVALAGGVVQGLGALLLLIPGLGMPAAFLSLALMSLALPLRGTALRALIADITPSEERARSYGAWRVAFNLGATLGPALGAALVARSWQALHTGIVAVSILAVLSALKLPSPPVIKDTSDLSISFWKAIQSVDFLMLMTVGFLFRFVYNALETLMPGSVTQTYGLAPSAWGLLIIINPVAVMLLQMRVSRLLNPRRQGLELAAGMALMGLPFLILIFTGELPWLVAIICLFVLGEMLAAPNQESLISRFAPPHLRGGYIGAVGASTWVGGSLTPAVGLSVRAGWGDAAMWAVVVAAALLAAALFGAASRRAVHHTK